MSKENFLFLASWHDILEGYDSAGKPEVASELAKQIIYYGVCSEITTEDPIISGIVSSMCATLIEKSKNRHRACVENGKGGGRPKKYNDEEIISLYEKFKIQINDIYD